MTPDLPAHNAHTDVFLKRMRRPVLLQFFLLRSLPAAYFSGVRIVSVTEPVCTVSVRYGWFTKNPFRSTYFACLAMAAEMSTGVLAMAQVWQRRPAVSMLITGMDSRFYKKATGRTLFTCTDGVLVQAAVAATANGPQTVRLRSEGRSEAGELVAEFWFEWSFKQKTPR